MRATVLLAALCGVFAPAPEWTARAAEPGAAPSDSAGDTRASPPNGAPAAQGADVEGSVFARKPPGYDMATVGRLRQLLVDAGEDLPGILQRMLQRGRHVGFMGSALLMALVVVVLVAFIGHWRLARRVEARLAPVLSAVPSGSRAWLAAAATVSTAAGPPFVLWLVHDLLRRMTGFDGPGFIIVGILLLAWSYYALVVTTVRELVLRPLIPMPPAYGRYLYGVTRWLALYGLVLYALLDAAAVVGMPPDVVALIQAVLDLSLIVMLTAFLARKRAAMALFPALPNRLYQLFVRGLGAGYPVVLALTCATLLLAWAGYVRLAHAVWMRSWALVGLFLAIVFTLHLLRRALHRAIVGDDAPARESARFYGSAARLLDIVGAWVFVMIAVDLSGAGDPLDRLLSLSVYSLADRRVSLMMGAQAVIVVAAFIFLARLLRDYLNYQVYPALAVDPGVSNAIDVFISYTMGVVGVLLSLEFVGVGVGVLTVFAGALGIGLGFGLQSIATNLTSGLTLVFGRALRRGDWVALGDTAGVIEEIGMRATSLRTRDAIEYLVPNAEFVSGTIVNWTRSSPHIREHVPVAVAYGADPEHVRGILLRVAAATPGVEAAPPPEVWFTGFGENSLEFEVLVWVNVKRVATPQLRSELYFSIFRAFKEAGVEIPSATREARLAATHADVADTPAVAPVARARRA
jgi:small-conductance mechanosensitive channel